MSASRDLARAIKACLKERTLSFRHAGVITGISYAKLNQYANNQRDITVGDLPHILPKLMLLDTKQFDPFFWYVQFLAEETKKLKPNFELDELASVRDILNDALVNHVSDMETPSGIPLLPEEKMFGDVAAGLVGAVKFLGDLMPGGGGLVITAGNNNVVIRAQHLILGESLFDQTAEKKILSARNSGVRIPESQLNLHGLKNLKTYLAQQQPTIVTLRGADSTILFHARAPVETPHRRSLPAHRQITRGDSTMSKLEQTKIYALSIAAGDEHNGCDGIAILDIDRESKAIEILYNTSPVDIWPQRRPDQEPEWQDLVDSAYQFADELFHERNRGMFLTREFAWGEACFLAISQFDPAHTLQQIFVYVNFMKDGGEELTRIARRCNGKLSEKFRLDEHLKHSKDGIYARKNSH